MGESCLNNNKMKWLKLCMAKGRKMEKIRELRLGKCINRENWMFWGRIVIPGHLRLTFVTFYKFLGNRLHLRRHWGPKGCLRGIFGDNGVFLENFKHENENCHLEKVV